MDIHSNTLFGIVEQCHELQPGSKFRTITNEPKSLDSDKMKVMYDSILKNSSLTKNKTIASFGHTVAPKSIAHFEKTQ